MKLNHRDLLRSPANFFALGFGAGLSARAPGTVGSLAALPFFFALQSLGATAYFFVLLAAFFAGIYFCARAADSLGHDHPAIVWDEMVGMWVALFPAAHSWSAVAAGFLLFRAFDIFKPPPIRQSERVRGGAGIMLDDLLAGIFANVVLQFLLAFAPGWLP